MNKAYIERLEEVGACRSAVEWGKTKRNPTTAWGLCERGDWMLWLLGKLAGKPWSAKRKPLVLCTCECARLALKHVPEGEYRPLKSIEIAEKWAVGGRIKQEDLEAAYAAASYAAYAAACAAASYAADAAAYAAAADAAADALKENQKETADICRKYLPIEIWNINKATE